MRNTESNYFVSCSQADGKNVCMMSSFSLLLFSLGTAYPCKLCLKSRRTNYIAINEAILELQLEGPLGVVLKSLTCSLCIFFYYLWKITI